MPAVACVDDLLRAVAEYPPDGPDLAADPAALDAARVSLDASGLLLLGEMHGVRENPQVISALMRALGITSLALEWPDKLASVVGDLVQSGKLVDHPMLWLGDGRITAGHLALLLAGRATKLVLFDDMTRPGWSERDQAMAVRVLAGCPPDVGTLVVAGNAHTPTTRTELGVPLGAHLARHRPGVREVRLHYGGGSFYNMEPKQFAGSAQPGPPRLSLIQDELVLALPCASEAVVPNRPGGYAISGPATGRR